MSQHITEITRRDIFDLLTLGIVSAEDPLFTHFLSWNGRMEETAFLSRLYNLRKLPSTDSRFADAAGDIYQHRTNNYDWDDNWVFDDPRFELRHGTDEILLNFLSEIFHPAVRSEREAWGLFLKAINDLLKPDGYQIVAKGQISGRDIYGWERLAETNAVANAQVQAINEIFNSQYISSQIEIMNAAIKTAPNVAIGKAKELLETCCKTILKEQKIEYDIDSDLTQLMKQACESIGLSAKQMDKRLDSGTIAAKILGNLTAISQGMAELRNLYGDGHGKEKDFQPLPSRYADLAVGTSVAAVKFMWDTYAEKK